jgi:nucleoid-associated protein YgaU
MAKNKKIEQKNNFDLKKILKTIKLNESSISLVLGIIVVLIAGILISKNFKDNKGSIPQELLNNANSIESKVKTHKVAKGENLWQISVKYYGDGFKWVDVATENKLLNASEIEVGQELIIPELENIAATEESPEISEDSYTIEKGDSLWSIAVRSYGDGYAWTKIAKENNISHPNLIHVGNVLKLPR